MIRLLIAALLLSTLPVIAGDAKSADAGQNEPEKEAPKPADPTLPADVLGFYGTVSGTVEKVDAGNATLTVKVASAVADAEKNKAPKPEALAGLTITVTPLNAKGKDDKTVLDEKAVAYIKGAIAGDSVTLAVRASTKGDVFRLLKVPAAGGK